MFTEKLLESAKQFAHVNATLRGKVARLMMRDAALRDPGQFTRNDFAINAVGDGQLRSTADQPQVFDILLIVARHIVHRRFPSQQGENHRLDPFFTEFIGQLVQVCRTALNEAFACRFVAFQGDRHAAVAGFAVFPGAFMRQGVDQPRLTHSVLPQLWPDCRVE